MKNLIVKAVWYTFRSTSRLLINAALIPPFSKALKAEVKIIVREKIPNSYGVKNLTTKIVPKMEIIFDKYLEKKT